jgi:hypothetical protein
MVANATRVARNTKVVVPPGTARVIPALINIALIDVGVARVSCAGVPGCVVCGVADIPKSCGTDIDGCAGIANKARVITSIAIIRGAAGVGVTIIGRLARVRITRISFAASVQTAHVDGWA